MEASLAAPRRKILVVDVGGTHVKVLATGQRQSRKIPSGPAMTPGEMVAQVRRLVKDWPYDVVSIGCPGPVVHGRLFLEPHNLGKGWVNFDFAKHFGCPVKIINDAAMQALGSYVGGRMLFLGLGTGLGAAMIVDGALQPMEIAHLPYKKKTYEDYLGLRGLEHYGKKRWRRLVAKVTAELTEALLVDYVILGGGNAKKLKKLPPNVKLGNNANAFVGGFRLWQQADPKAALNFPPKPAAKPTTKPASKPALVPVVRRIIIR
jgi:hypothetical protein